MKVVFASRTFMPNMDFVLEVYGPRWKVSFTPEGWVHVIDRATGKGVMVPPSRVDRIETFPDSSFEPDYVAKHKPRVFDKAEPILGAEEPPPPPTAMMKPRRGRPPKVPKQ